MRIYALFDDQAALDAAQARLEEAGFGDAVVRVLDRSTIAPERAGTAMPRVVSPEGEMAHLPSAEGATLPEEVDRDGTLANAVRSGGHLLVLDGHRGDADRLEELLADLGVQQVRTERRG